MVPNKPDQVGEVRSSGAIPDVPQHGLVIHYRKQKAFGNFIPWYTVNPLLFVCKKFLRGSWKPLWCEYFLLQTSPCRMVAITTQPKSRWGLVANISCHKQVYRIKSSQIKVGLQSKTLSLRVYWLLTIFMYILNKLQENTDFNVSLAMTSAILDVNSHILSICLFIVSSKYMMV